MTASATAADSVDGDGDWPESEVTPNSTGPDSDEVAYGSIPTPDAAPPAPYCVGLTYGDDARCPFPPSIPSTAPLALPLPLPPLPPFPLPARCGLISDVVPKVRSCPMLVASRTVLLRGSPCSCLLYTSAVHIESASLESPAKRFLKPTITARPSARNRARPDRCRPGVGGRSWYSGLSLIHIFGRSSCLLVRRIPWHGRDWPHALGGT